MVKINLRDYYTSLYENDHFIEVDEEIAEAMNKTDREDHAYYERRRYHKAFYSLNVGDDIENDCVNHSPSPEEIYINQIEREQLYAALDDLSELQRRRLTAHFIHGMSVTEIAQAEGTSKSSISESIKRGLKNIKKYFKNF